VTAIGEFATVESADALPANIRHAPDQVVEEFKSCQDMTLYPDDEKFVNPTLSALMTNPDRDVCEEGRNRSQQRQV
jgi:hypothetical protein